MDSAERAQPHPAGQAGQSAGGRSELFLRVVSALILAPIAIGITYLGGWPFMLLWAAAAAGILWEWTRLIAGRTERHVLMAGVVALAASFAALAMNSPTVALANLAVGAAVAAMIAPAGKRTWFAGGVVYAGLALVLPVLLRADAQHGFVAILFLFAVVWATDIAAYFAGRAFGGPKLAVRLSPKKTWSGALGGTFCAILAGVMTAAIAGLDSLAMIAIISLVLSVSSQTGDLAESALKRTFGAKDASQLIPGHGGLMDRLDGFLIAALVATIIGVSRGGTDGAARGFLLW